jgi:hypothetical protein
MRAAADADALAIRNQIKAAVAQSEATQRAARAQLQPIVFARVSGGARRPSTTAADAVDGPRKMIGADLADGEIGFPYTLANEGTGIALDVHHGVEIAASTTPLAVACRCTFCTPVSRCRRHRHLIAPG